MRLDVFLLCSVVNVTKSPLLMCSAGSDVISASLVMPDMKYSSIVFGCMLSSFLFSCHAFLGLLVLCSKLDDVSISSTCDVEVSPKSLDSLV